MEDRLFTSNINPLPVITYSRTSTFSVGYLSYRYRKYSTVIPKFIETLNDHILVNEGDNEKVGIEEEDDEDDF